MKNYFGMSDQTHDPNDPNPWLALLLDQSTPFQDQVKDVWLRDCSSRSRQFFLPFVRPAARLTIVVIQVLKIFLPNWRAPKSLHHVLVFCLKTFVRPEANWFILRHFHLGSEILEFLAKNVQGVDIPLRPLRPMVIDDLRDELFVKHDINLYNFVINFNRQLRDKNLDMVAKSPLDFSMITTRATEIELPKRGWFNVIDLESAIELFTPVYQLFLSDVDFWRATNSLQLDETIAIYMARLLKMSEHLVLLNNKHPLVQLITMTAGFRLVLHGLSTEMLHALLLKLKNGELHVARPVKSN